jgi:predicted transglutaminase-like cysteine proteinase
MFSIEWRVVQSDWLIERDLLARCRANGCSSQGAAQFLVIINEAKTKTGRARLGFINRAINLAIRPMSDAVNYGMTEVWKASLATLTNGAGNCTDYALAKYFALGEMPTFQANLL